MLGLAPTAGKYFTFMLLMGQNLAVWIGIGQARQFAGEARGFGVGSDIRPPAHPTPDCGCLLPDRGCRAALPGGHLAAIFHVLRRFPAEEPVSSPAPLPAPSGVRAF